MKINLMNSQLVANLLTENFGVGPAILQKLQRHASKASIPLGVWLVQQAIVVASSPFEHGDEDDERFKPSPQGAEANTPAPSSSMHDDDGADHPASYPYGDEDQDQDEDEDVAHSTQAPDVLFELPHTSVEYDPSVIQMDIEFEALCLPTRPYNALVRAGYASVERIVAAGPKFISKLMGIGPGSMQEITDAMAKIGISFALNQAGQQEEPEATVDEATVDAPTASWLTVVDRTERMSSQDIMLTDFTGELAPVVLLAHEGVLRGLWPNAQFVMDTYFEDEKPSLSEMGSFFTYIKRRLESILLVSPSQLDEAVKMARIIGQNEMWALTTGAQMLCAKDMNYMTYREASTYLRDLADYVETSGDDVSQDVFDSIAAEDRERSEDELDDDFLED